MMKCLRWLGAACVCAAGAASSGDTFTWTGNGDGRLWSDAANWSTDATTHTVPASGDRVIVTGLQKGAVVSNDIAGLSLPYLEIGGDASAAPSFRLYGQAITLTGGWDAFVARTGRFFNYIPFVLAQDDANPVVRFDFARTKDGASVGGRMDQRADISGSAQLFLNYPNYYTPSVDMTYSGGTVCNGGTVDPSAHLCFGDVGGLVEVRGCQFRFYSAVPPVPYTFSETSSRNDHTCYFWCDPQATGAFTGRRFSMSWGSGTRTFNGPITVDAVQIYGDAGNRGTVVFNGRVETPAFNALYNTYDGRHSRT